MSDALIVRRGGSGLSPNNAVIHVTSSTGSTITFTKGGVIAKTLGPEKQHISAEDSTVAEWYLPVGPSNYGTWTVTATLEGKTSSKAVSVSSNQQYDVELRYSVYIYREGVSGLAEGYSGIDGRYGISEGTVFDSPLGIVLKYPNDYWTIGPAVDLSKYSTFHVDLQVTADSSSHPYIGVSNTTTSGANGANFSYLAEWHATGAVSRQTVAIDVSALQIPGYIKACGYSPSEWTIFNMWFDF